MANLVSTRAVGPPRQRRTTDLNNHRAALDMGEGQAAQADRADDTTRVTQLHYRKTHRDYSCIRVVAASAIVAGLLLGTGPIALAQVSQLLATLPAAFTQQVPTLAAASPGANDVQRDSAETTITMQHRLDTPATPSLISWNGTTQALKCSYGLLFEGNTRNCQAA
ncbi:MAG: hypothetical protein ACRDRA_15845 [Pseudonocardiaceae bacterium]